MARKKKTGRIRYPGDPGESGEFRLGSKSIPRKKKVKVYPPPPPNVQVSEYKPGFCAYWIGYHRIKVRCD